MKNLDALLEQYVILQEQEASIKAAKEEIKNEFIKAFGEMGVNSYTSADGGLKGSLSYKTAVKYNDEVAIIKYLKNNGMSTYLKTVIDTTNFNKTLRSSQKLQESLAGKFTVSETPSLTVKKV